jgi:centrin-3
MDASSPHAHVQHAGSPLYAQQQPYGAGSPLFMGMRPRARPPPRQLTEDQEGEVAYAFDRLSEGQGGQEVTPRQLKIALRALGFPVKKADVRGLLRDGGHDAAAPMCFDVFREACAAKLLERSPHEEVARAFQLFDLSGSGRIAVADLRAIAKQLQVRGLRPFHPPCEPAARYLLS